jgi:cytoskeletal protein CcmA (bactofilin family)
MWEKKDPYKAQPAENPAGRDSAPDTRVLVNLGKSIVIKGEVSGHEDLSIDGKVVGKVSLQEHNLTVGKHGRLDAELVAKRVIIKGQVTGNVYASEKVDILEGGQLDGDITAPRLSIADGAHFRGKVDMEGGEGVSMHEDTVASISGKVSA